MQGMPIELSTIVRRSKSQVSCTLNDEVAILNLESTLYFGLNEVGSFIWQALSEPKRVGELCEAVLDCFEIDAALCRTDVIRLLTELEEAGLIEIIPSQAAGD
jgi:hypothetical protein